MKVRNLLCFALLFISFSSLYDAAYLGRNKFGLDIFTIDLSLPEKERFKETAQFYKTAVMDIFHQYEVLFPSYLQPLMTMVGRVLHFFHEGYYQEAEGIAEVLGADINLVMFL